jgi:peptidoglycan/LPS O-acetylase OafA/YrhL
MNSIAPLATGPAAAGGRESRNAFIDLLRGIAILGVVLHHLFANALNAAAVRVDIAGSDVSIYVFNNGWLGVNLFFILSGFVLYRPGIAADRKSVIDYYVSRATRLWPLLFIFITFICIIDQKSPLKFASYIVLYLSGLNSILPRSWMSGAIVAVLWSLGVEILFSILLPGLLALVRRMSLMRVLLTVAVFCFAYRIFADQAWWGYLPDYANPQLNPFKDNIFGRLDDFLFGMAAAHLVRAGWAPRRGLVWIAAVVLTLDLFGWNYLTATGIPRTQTMSALASLLHVGFAAPAMVLIAALVHLPLWIRPAFLPLVVCGQLCYSIYLFHAFFIRYVPPQLTVSGVAVYLALTFGTAAVFFVYVESAGIHRMPPWTRPFRLSR